LISKDIIDRAVERRREEIVGFLQEMIRIPSENPPGDYEPICDYLSAKLKGMGFETRVTGKEGKPNVVATLKGNRPGRTLILNPHIDVVPAGDGWSVAPYGGEVRDGRVYGRGAYDCKGADRDFYVRLEDPERTGSLLR
jgi:succinyl-diaminopimelate desuccinylase